MLKLTTFSPTADSSELAPLLHSCRDVKVLGLGEPTHGTREAFQLKHRIIRALAENGMLGTVAFECGLANGRLIDDYVRRGIGTAQAAVQGQRYWCWSTREVVDFVEWLRSFNAALPAEKRIAFFGIDLQRVDAAIPELLEQLAKLQANPAMDSALLARTITGLEQLRDGAFKAGSPSADQLALDLFEISELLDDHWPRALCLNLARHAETYLGPPETFLARRDEFMAATLHEVTGARPGLTALWAHNEHVAVNPDFFGSPSLGYWLRQDLGKRYLSLGMLLESGSFRARTMRGDMMKVHRVTMPPTGHDELAFSGEPAHIRLSPRNHSSGLRRYIGAQFEGQAAGQSPELFALKRPLGDFDFVAWIPESTATLPI